MTCGPGQKFGCDLDMVSEAAAAAAEVGARIVGLHAHSGSGITNPQNWPNVATTLLMLCRSTHEDGTKILPDVAWMDVGGGLGVADGFDHMAVCEQESVLYACRDDDKLQRPAAVQLDLLKLQEALADTRAACDELGVKLRMEPGRFFVSPCGVLVTKVTQVRTKRGRRFIGSSAGMNALIRPALYGSYHSIVNLTRMLDPVLVSATVVGPICESGDVLGNDRPMPASTSPGDTLCVSNAGAYGAVMSSRYNRKPAVREIVVQEVDGDLVPISSA